MASHIGNESLAYEPQFCVFGLTTTGHDGKAVVKAGNWVTYLQNADGNDHDEGLGLVHCIIIGLPKSLHNSNSRTYSVHVVIEPADVHDDAGESSLDFPLSRASLSESCSAHLPSLFKKASLRGLDSLIIIPARDLRSLAMVKHCCFKYNCYSGGDDDGDQHNGSRVTCDTVHCKDHVVFSCV